MQAGAVVPEKDDMDSHPYGSRGADEMTGFLTEVGVIVQVRDKMDLQSGRRRGPGGDDMDLRPGRSSAPGKI